MKEVGIDDTSVHPALRTSDMSLTCYVAWSYEQRILDDTMIKAAEILGKKLQNFGHGVYVNEPAASVTNWKSDFWGGHYDQLLEIKKKWDPENLLQCHYCVGMDVDSTQKSSSEKSNVSFCRNFYLTIAVGLIVWLR